MSSIERRPPERTRTSPALVLVLFLCWLGTVDAAVLLAIDARGIPGLCAEGSPCDLVLHSRYAHPIGVPLPLVGLAYYAALAAGVATRAARGGSAGVSLAIDAASGLGVAASTVLTCIQVLAIRAVCPFCVASAALCFAIFVALALTRSARASRGALVLFLAIEAATVGLGLIAWRERRADAPWRSVLPALHADLDPNAAKVIGDARAPAVVSVFFDHECPFCRNLMPTLEELRRTSNGRVALALYALPLAGHAQAEVAARAIECAGEQGKLAELHDRVSRAPRIDEASLAALAKEAGLDAARMGACLARPGPGPWIEASRAEAARFGVSAVPTVYVNGALYLGERTLGAFRDEVERRARDPGR